MNPHMVSQTTSKIRKDYGTEQQVAARAAAQDVAQDRFWQEVAVRLERREKQRQGLVQARPGPRK